VVLHQANPPIKIQKAKAPARKNKEVCLVLPVLMEAIAIEEKEQRNIEMMKSSNPNLTNNTEVAISKRDLRSLMNSHFF